jgi:hypothetical protein
MTCLLATAHTVPSRPIRSHSDPIPRPQPMPDPPPDEEPIKLSHRGEICEDTRLLTVRFYHERNCDRFFYPECFACRPTR